MSSYYEQEVEVVIEPVFNQYTRCYLCFERLGFNDDLDPDEVIEEHIHTNCARRAAYEPRVKYEPKPPPQDHRNQRPRGPKRRFR